nr:D-sedoheptulose 7-phosphate isomerase [Roseibium aestuarii]
MVEALEAEPALRGRMSEVVQVLCAALRGGGKLLLAGNGGSSAEAQHMAAEYVGRFLADRPGLPAIALTTDSSILTALGNDYGFETVFSRQVETLGKPGDVLMVYSTSGRSPNILKAVGRAKALGMTVIGFTGEGGQTLAEACDLCLVAPTQHTPHIQELHLMMGHMICGLVEACLFAGAEEG